MALVSLETALAHLRLTVEEGSPTNPYAEDVQQKLNVATAIVLIHIKRQNYDEWSEETDPASDPEFAIVQGAILKVLGNLHRFRGDDSQIPGAVEGPMTKDIVDMLSPLRMPSLA